MKKLLLPVYVKKNKPKASHKYYILFDIGQRLEFKSRRKAEDYSRKISSYIVDSVRVLNTIQKELYSCYLELYFRLNKGYCYKIHLKLDEYLERLQYFHLEQSRGNASIKFTAVYSLLNIVQDSSSLLIKGAKSLKDYNTVSRLNGYLQMIITIYDKMSSLKKGDTSTIYKTSKLSVVHNIKNIKSME